jgi:hypothetical protein
MSDSNWTDFDIGYGRKPKQAAPVPQPAGWSLTKVVLVFLVVVVAATASALGTRQLMANARQRFHNQLVADAFQQYQIVDGGDDLMAKALRAGVVAEAYLMAKDADNYNKWKKIADDWDALAKQKIEAETKAMMRRFSR